MTIIESSQSSSLDAALERFAKEARREEFETGRYHCKYYVWGSGPPLLIAHGMGDTSLSYIPLVAALSRDFQCIAYDQPYGPQDGSRLNRYTHGDLVADALALLDHLEIRQCDFFGTSFGSTIVLATMHAASQRIGHGVVAGGFAFRKLSPGEKLLASVAQVLPGSARQLPLRRLINSHNFGPSIAYRQEYFEYLLQVSKNLPIRGIARKAKMIGRTDLRSILPEIQQPVLVITGDCDALVGRRCVETLLKGLPQTTHVELTDCGHFAHYSHPEVVAEVVRRFLRPAACPLAH
jgi:pimeloyl-ACP methyl ester carboxylesterase